MGWTRRDFCETALEELGIAADVFDSQPELLESARKRLDAMMAEWNARGIRLGYPIGSDPMDGDLDDATGVPDSANEAIYTSLAVRLAPTYGKTPMPETKATAARGYQTVLSRAAMPPQMQMPATMPAGAGHKRWRDNASPFLDPPSDPLVAGDDAEITFE
jgi:hypothetical protein